jgi:hypothetical protein
MERKTALGSNSFLPLCGNLRNLRIVFSALIVGACAVLSAAEPDQAAKDEAAVRKFLAGQYQGKSWQQGPAAVQSGAVEKAFPDLRFYYVFSSPSPRPRAELISVMMRVEKGGSVGEVAGAAAMNQGLMKVASTADATLAAAAVMSLTFGPDGPVAIAPGDVRVARQGGGWYCLATPGPPGGKRQALSVTFDAAGRCIDIVHRSTGR